MENSEPKPKINLGVRETDEWMVYEVDSASGADPYRVDLEAFPFAVDTTSGPMLEYNGQCGCPHFSMILIKSARKGVVARCKHIEAARNQLCNKFIYNESKALQRGG